jgi:hypothetical protein
MKLDYNKNKLLSTIRNNTFSIITKENLNNEFQKFTNFLNGMRDKINNIQDTPYISQGNYNTFFANTRDGRVVQLAEQDIFVSDNIDIENISSETIANNSILETDAQGSLKFKEIIPNCLLYFSNDSFDFSKITSRNLGAVQIPIQSIKDNSISIENFDNAIIPYIANRLSRDNELNMDNFDDESISPIVSRLTETNWTGFFALQKDSEVFNNVAFVNQNFPEKWILPYLITPKALGNNAINSIPLSNRLHVPTTWSILIKERTKKMQSILETRSWYRDFENNFSLFVYIFYNNTKPNLDPLLSRYYNDLDSIIEYGGTFDDNLFTNDLFFVSPSQGYQNYGYSYCGPLFISQYHLNPNFKINKRMCYEAVYANNVPHRFPPLQKSSVPPQVVEALERVYGVVDSDWT